MVLSTSRASIDCFKLFVAGNQFEKIENKRGVLVLGRMGAGKSTTISVQLGAEYEALESGHLKLMYSPQWIPQTSNDWRSKTLQVQLYHDKPSDILYLDTPGLNENLGDDYRDWTSFSTAMVFSLLKDVQAVIIMVDFSEAFGSRGEGIRKLAEALSPITGKGESSEFFYNSAIFVYTNAWRNGKPLSPQNIYSTAASFLDAEKKTLQQTLSELKGMGSIQVKWAEVSEADKKNVQDTEASILLLQAMVKQHENGCAITSCLTEAKSCRSQRQAINKLIHQVPGITKTQLASIIAERETKSWGVEGPLREGTMSTTGWQSNLIDEEGGFLRGVNEGYRTWCLRLRKIQLLQKELETAAIHLPTPEDPTPYDGAPRLAMRVQQLKAMTLGQPADSTDETVQAVLACEVVMAALAKFHAGAGPAAAKTAAEGIGEAGPSTTNKMSKEAKDGEAVEEPVQTLAQCLDGYKDQMHALENQVDVIFESKYAAEMELKEFEQKVLQQWKLKKQESEHWTKRHAALTGMRSAMRAVLQRHEWHDVDEEWAEWAFPPTHETEHLVKEESYAGAVSWNIRKSKVCGKNEPASLSQEQKDYYQDIKDSLLVMDPNSDAGMHALSDVLAEGVTDPKEREEILKREHAGSAEHPHGCRPCHFQSGLCWKGLACSFCHICPKPKRKSKHQRDVDKRRQERYKQVKDDLGIPCLDELTKIDDVTRQIMTSSEELKKRIKDACASKQPSEIADAVDMVAQMKTTIDSYHSAMPVLT